MYGAAKFEVPNNFDAWIMLCILNPFTNRAFKSAYEQIRSCPCLCHSVASFDLRAPLPRAVSGGGLSLLLQDLDADPFSSIPSSLWVHMLRFGEFDQIVSRHGPQLSIVDPRSRPLAA